MVRTLIVLVTLATNLTLPLFRAAPAPATATPPAMAVRYRYVTLRTWELRPYELRARGTAQLNLFANADYTAIVDRVSSYQGWIVWSGHLRGIPYSYFHILRSGNLCIVHVGSPQGVYEVTWVSGAVYRVVQMRQRQGID